MDVPRLNGSYEDAPRFNGGVVLEVLDDGEELSLVLHSPEPLLLFSFHHMQKAESILSSPSSF